MCQRESPVEGAKLSTAHIMLNGLPARSRLMIMKTALHLLNVAQGMSPSPVETLKVMCFWPRIIYTGGI